MEFVYWALGIWIPASLGGFFFLSKRLNELSDHIDTSKKFAETFARLVADVHEIKEALLGNFDKPGLIRRVHDIDRDVKELKSVIK